MARCRDPPAPTNPKVARSDTLTRSTADRAAGSRAARRVEGIELRSGPLTAASDLLGVTRLRCMRARASGRRGTASRPERARQARPEGHVSPRGWARLTRLAPACLFAGED